MPGLEGALAAWHARPVDARPVLLMDFDGTLVGFDVNPSSVTLPESCQVLLQTLARRADMSCGIVSGRRISDLRGRAFGGSSFFYAGLHGLEIEGPGIRYVHPGIALVAPTIGVVAGELRSATASLPGVLIEDKGFSVALHTRGASKGDRLHAITRFQAISEPHLRNATLRLQPGDLMVELLPNVDWTKGDAVRSIIRHVEAQHKTHAWPAYIGDDSTDDDAFEEIGETGLTISVSSRPVGASFRLSDPAAVEQFLRAILSSN